MTEKTWPRRIHDSSNGLDYILRGDYYYPDIEGLDADPRPIGKWGRMHKRFLQECKPIQFQQLVLQGKLNSYLADLNEQAQARRKVIIRQMQHSDGVDENLKVQDQMLWVRRMNNIRQQAEEIVMNEIIFA